MEITYIGHSCFKIKGKNITMIIDPYDPKKVGYNLPKLSADVVLTTHKHEDHNFIEGVKDHKFVVETAGEYEFSDAFIYGYQTSHDDENGTARGSNIIYQIFIDDFSILHLGDLGQELSKETLEKLSDVDVLMIPVGGKYTIDAKTAVKVISSIEPAIIVPMHYQTDDLTGLSEKLQGVKEFLEEIGVEGEGVKREDKLAITTRLNIPEENEVYVLSPQH